MRLMVDDVAQRESGHHPTFPLLHGKISPWIGAYQSRLAASISNLETTSMNLQASRSRILDTDYAKETTILAKSQTTRLSGHRHTGPGQPVRPVGAGAAQISATA